MAAYRTGVKTVVIPADNLPDLAEIDPAVKAGVEFVPASELSTVSTPLCCHKPISRTRRPGHGKTCRPGAAYQSAAATCGGAVSSTVFVVKFLYGKEGFHALRQRPL